jgi:hypothetical protein
VPLAQPPLDLGGFPIHVIKPSTPLFRIHRRRLNPWWYSRDGSGRFDLVSFGDHGTCYLAEREIGSFVETFRDTVPIAMLAIEERRTSEFFFPNELTVADCTSRAARGFGITAELHSGRDYSRPQAWATALALEGFDGIRYFVSHDPAQDLVGIALFGSAGDVPTESRPRDIDRGVLAAAELEFGLRALPTTEG